MSEKNTAQFHTLNPDQNIAFHQIHLSILFWLAGAIVEAVFMIRGYRSSMRMKFHFAVLFRKNQPIWEFILQWRTGTSRCSLGDQLAAYSHDRLSVRVTYSEVHLCFLLQACTFQLSRSDASAILRSPTGGDRWAQSAAQYWKYPIIFYPVWCLAVRFTEVFNNQI